VERSWDRVVAIGIRQAKEDGDGEAMAKK